MVNLRWLIKYTSGWIGCEHMENPVLSYDIPGLYRAIILRSATQAQRDHKIIHARNFRVQPQAITGSGIVEYVA